MYPRMLQVSFAFVSYSGVSATSSRDTAPFGVSDFFAGPEAPLALSLLRLSTRGHYASEQFASCGDSLLCCRRSFSFHPQIIEATPSRAKRCNNDQITKW